jgi:HPt (histidine-containing phosphotransfer) domain-containing protein
MPPLWRSVASLEGRAKIDPLPPELGSGEIPLERGTRRSPKILDLLLRLVPGQVQAIVDAAASGDTAALASQAHKLKGSCLSVGAMRLAHICHDVEGLAEEGNLLAARESVGALDVAWPELRAALEAERATHR